MKRPCFHWVNPDPQAAWNKAYNLRYNSIVAHQANEVWVGHQNDYSPSEMDGFIQRNSGKWIFFFISYDYSNHYLPVQSPATVLFPVPQIILLAANSVSVDATCSWNESYKPKNIIETPRALVDESAYLKTFEILKHHIQQGDIYEINYCIPFLSAAELSDPYSLWHHLVTHQPMPFSIYFTYGNLHIMSASPERFFSTHQCRIVSQPMKGTLRRSETSFAEIEQQLLKNNPKERCENVMIVDLVRNDLSRIAEKGSVQVDELFGIYTFPSVHQMISSISATIKPGTSFSSIIEALFPMGSMTGAPKIRAMQLISQYEAAARGAFSGTLGYIDPQGNIDCSVLIRSIFYHDTLNLLSFSAGSAITSQANAHEEYKECLLKASAIFDVLKSYQHASAGN
jgi:para-aminobenzoate synthetase component 1